MRVFSFIAVFAVTLSQIHGFSTLDPHRLTRLSLIRRKSDHDISSECPLVAPSFLLKSTKVNHDVPVTQSLPPHTFAGMVERSIIERFGEEPTYRIVHSWRLLEMGYEHKEFLGDGNPNTSNCHQHAHSYVPGLKAQQFYNIHDHPWCGSLAKNYKDLKKEFSKVTSDMASLQEKGKNVWASALTEEASSYGTGWKTLVLMDRGIWDSTNSNLFPKTTRAVRDSGAPVTEVFFASMQPNSTIQPHSDFTNFVITCHLALDIPESGSNKCRLTVGDETRQWINGEVMLFDTSIRHDAINESNQTRYILMLRVWHPDLTLIERTALQFIYDCLAIPGLVSPDANEQSKAEAELKALKQFPLFKGSGGAGFGKATPNKEKGKFIRKSI